MSLGRKHHATRGEQLDLRGAAAQFFACGLAHRIGAVGDHRHHRKRPDVAARIGLLVGRAEVGAAAGLGERPAGIVEPRPYDLALGQQPGGGMVGAAGLADGGVAVHQAVAQVVRRGDGDVGGRIGNVLGGERQAGDVGVGVYEARHQRAPADIDRCRPASVDRLGRYRRDATVAHQHVEAALQFSEPVKDEMGIDEKRLRHAGSVSYCRAMNDTSSALVLFSGGQDSTTCLAWALSRYERVETIGFAYGQRHAVEMDVRDPVRRRIASLGSDWSRRLGPDRVVSLDVLGSVSKSALTADLPMDTRPDGLPATFVPGRNLVFLTFAAIVAHQRGMKHVVAGVCETDFSGYPDCRDDTVKALQVAINLGMEARLVLETPLMWIDKADTWRLAETLGGRALVDLIIEETHTCYQGDRVHRHDWGVGCGSCDACRLRANGWARYRAGSPP